MLLELSLSSLRHVIDGAGFLQLFLSFAPSTSESACGPVFELGSSLLSWGPIIGTAKFVFAFWPLIRTAAWSYALAAASAVSNMREKGVCVLKAFTCFAIY
ncbi:cellulose synthase family protein [Striga asiatica]|uniref:Cellulose synthase family protein n=1 Tax=Striga asiatica TaxID=4170 RepID=A0A5A7PRV8_STRAF|nr:cellulose synthase family protein [Striga asiatica]